MMPAKRSLLIGTFVFEQTAPAFATRKHPRLTKAGNILRSFEYVTVNAKCSTNGTEAGISLTIFTMREAAREQVSHSGN